MGLYLSTRAGVLDGTQRQKLSPLSLSTKRNAKKLSPLSLISPI